MPIKFITAEETKEELTFGMVKENQFFVNRDGDLCQKCNGEEANIIASPDGSPWAVNCLSFSESKLIKRILPEITKIEF